MSSETSAIRTQTPGNYPKRNKLHLEHGESLKTRNFIVTLTCKWHMGSRWHTSHLHIVNWTFKHLSHHEAKAYIQIEEIRGKYLQPGVDSLLPVGICANHLQTRCLLRGPEVEITGPDTINQICDWLWH